MIDNFILREVQNENSVLFAICSVDSNPWDKICLEGTFKTWLKRIENTDEVRIVLGPRPNQVTKFLSERIEDLRWHSGKAISYFLAYFLMFTLFPLRSLIPKLHEEIVTQNNHVIKYKKWRLFFPESLTSLRWKKIAIVNHFLQNFDHDFLVIANPSTYVNIPQLRKLLALMKEDYLDRPLYCGMVEKSADSLFVVGSFILLNRVAARTIIDKRFQIPVHTLDDVAFGKLFSDLGILPVDCHSKRISTLEDLTSMPKEQIIDCINFKVKSIGQTRAESDIDMLKKIDCLLFQEDTN